MPFVPTVVIAIHSYINNRENLIIVVGIGLFLSVMLTPPSVDLIKSELDNYQKIITKVSFVNNKIIVTTNKLMFFKNGLISREEVNHNSINDYLNVREIKSEKHGYNYEFYDSKTNHIFYKLFSEYYSDSRQLRILMKESFETQKRKY